MSEKVNRISEQQTGSVTTQKEVQSYSKSLLKDINSEINQVEKRSETMLSHLFIAQLIILAVLISISVGISIYITRYFIKPIKDLSSFMKQVSDGNLSETMQVDKQDEVGILFSSVNKMITSFREMISKITGIVNQVDHDSHILNQQAEATSSISETVSVAMVQIASGSEQLAEDMVNISYNVESNVGAVRSMNNNIQTIITHMDKTKSYTSQGKDAMANLSTKMIHISNQANESTSIMKSLDSKLQTISDITMLIHSISEQTNLLSLNASIEAARAGEHGRSFTVVAQEVKKLADQSSHSVEKISTLIQDIQSSSSKALFNIEQGKRIANQGAELSKETEKSINQIYQFISNLAVDIEEIAAANDILNQSSDSISHSVDSVVSISEQTSAGVQEVASTSDENKRSVESVKEISKNLKVLTNELRLHISHFQI